MDSQQKYWFPAKKYGWGWGLPNGWQGWLVLAGYVATLILLSQLFPPREHHATFVVGVGMLTLVLLAICWIKGEPPRWRWGGKS